jgi:radical SAM protein with 4Fe4S-binding SPASM domain
MDSTTVDLSWIDGFVDRIRSYVFVRETDGVLIRMPNEAFKLNRSGAVILSHLLGGGTIKDVVAEKQADQPDISRQLTTFFRDLSILLSGDFCESYTSPAVTRVGFDLGYIELPILSEVALTYRCNIKCRFCYASCRCRGDDDRKTDRGEMSTSDAKTLLRKIRDEAGVPSVSFTGGEPTMRNDLADLIRFASHTLGMRVNLITNGTLITDTSARAFHRAGLASAQVSIEAPDALLHDHIVQRTGAFERSVMGMMALKKTGIIVHPHTTICRQNESVAHKMAAFAKSKGIKRFSANLVIPAGRGGDQDLRVAYSDIGPVLEDIEQSARKEDVTFMWYSPTPLCLFNPISHQMGNKGCSACEGLLSINPEGQVLPCSSWQEPLGSLLDHPFRSIWFSHRSSLLRRKEAAHEKCRQCEHFPVCHGACPLYFNIWGYDELEPEFRRMKQEVVA